MSRYRGVVFGAVVAALVAGTLTVGALKLYGREQEALASAEHRRTFVPSVQVATVKPAGDELVVRLPATTSAFLFLTGSETDKTDKSADRFELQ